MSLRWRIECVFVIVTKWYPKLELGRFVYCPIMRDLQSDCGRRPTEDTRWIYSRLLELWRSSKVKTNHLVPKVAAPEQSSTNLGVFTGHLHVLRVLVTVDPDAHIFDKSECHPTPHPSLSLVSGAHFVGAHQKHCLDGCNVFFIATQVKYY